MTESEIKQFNYTQGGHNYVLRGNADWVAFQKHIVERLIKDFGEQFNFIIYWNEAATTNVGYICVPYSIMKTVMTEEHLSHKKDGSVCWNFIIKEKALMVHANSKYAIPIEPYLNSTLLKHSVTEVSPLSVEEGRRLIAKHHRIERNRTIVNAVKQKRYEEDPLLRCEVCGFSFIQKYGEIGRNFIEAHHKVPLSELQTTTTTRMTDFVLVCSNCHRMLHSCVPALSVAELRRRIGTPELPID
jgi:predicted HNH restriction endonuclease